MNPCNHQTSVLEEHYRESIIHAVCGKDPIGSNILRAAITATHLVLTLDYRTDVGQANEFIHNYRGN